MHAATVLLINAFRIVFHWLTAYYIVPYLHLSLNCEREAQYITQNTEAKLSVQQLSPIHTEQQQLTHIIPHTNMMPSVSVYIHPGPGIWTKVGLVCLFPQNEKEGPSKLHL